MTQPATVVGQLLNSMDEPLAARGSQELAWLAIDQLPEEGAVSVLDHVAGKILQTLADGEFHDALALAPDGGVALWFNAWPGGREEVLPQRVGDYVERLYGQAHRLIDQSGRPVTGFLEIDVYVTAKSPGELDGLEVEYSFLPGVLLGGTNPEDPKFNTILVNPALCTPEELAALEKFVS